MSAGAFGQFFYASDSGEVYNMRAQPETGGLIINTVQNASAAGPPTAEPSAVVSGSTRKAGVNARRVRVLFTGAAPEGYEPNSPITLPIFTLAAFTGIRKGQTGTYLGSAIRVIGKSPEKIN